MKILHIANPQNFTKPFFSLIERNFDVKDHAILSRGKINDWPIGLKISNKTLTGASWCIDFLRSVKKAEKIILHGLFDPRVVVLLALQPSILLKCYWMIWGGDLYSHALNQRNIKWKIIELFRRPVIRRIGHLITYVPGDVDLARKWYCATGQHHECIMYTSNIYRDYAHSSAPSHTTINIQIGNSADPSNNHLEILEKLKPFLDKDIVIYAPLSYGNSEYSKKIISVGKEIYGEKFKPITDYMTIENYINLLGKIDIAIFNHKRQQAMGNTITLLGLGKKVYMRSDITPWSMFKNLQIKVFDNKNIEINKIPEKSRLTNINNIKNRFSEPVLLSELKNIFTNT